MFRRWATAATRISSTASPSWGCRRTIRIWWSTWGAAVLAFHTQPRESTGVIAGRDRGRRGNCAQGCELFALVCPFHRRIAQAEQRRLGTPLQVRGAILRGFAKLAPAGSAIDHAESRRGTGAIAQPEIFHLPVDVLIAGHGFPYLAVGFGHVRILALE